MELHFRKIAEDDLEMIMNWRAMPEVSAFMYTDIELDIEKQRQWYRSICADRHRLDWVIRVDGEDVGLVSIVKIDPVNHRAEWAYYLASPSVRGKGIGKSVEMNILTYVFDELNLNKLCCEVYVANALVIKIHEKYGSVVEGTRRSHICKNGEYLDVVEMGVLRSDWEAKVKGTVEYTQAEFDAIDKEVVRVESLVR